MSNPNKNSTSSVHKEGARNQHHIAPSTIRTPLKRADSPGEMPSAGSAVRDTTLHSRNLAPGRKRGNR